MQKALLASMNGEMSVRKAAIQLSVPRATLFDRVQHAESFFSSKSKGRLRLNLAEPSLGRKPVFSAAQEKALEEHLIQLDRLCHGMCPLKVRQLAFEYAEKNGIQHNFNKDRKLAGWAWYTAFMARHPRLSERLPESTSLGRLIGFNRKDVEQFYQNLYDVFEKDAYDATEVFNVDETGLGTVPTKVNRVIAERGRKQVGSIKSAERGTLVTAVMCISAGGTYVPPMLVYPRAKTNDKLMKGAPPGSIQACSPNGWVNREVFTRWLDHFIKFAGCSKEKKTCLIMDNHESPHNVGCVGTST